MPTIQLTDQFGLDVDVKTDVLSSLEKYAANLSKLSLTGLNLQSIADLTLANPAITSLHAGLNLDQPVNIGAGGVTLQLNAGLGGTMDIYVPPTGGGCLFDSDLYGETISVGAAERYVSIALSASAGPDISATVNQLTFAFQPGVKVSLANYQKFETQPAAADHSRSRSDNAGGLLHSRQPGRSSRPAHGYHRHAGRRRHHHFQRAG